jgi:hypothetical protein
MASVLEPNLDGGTAPEASDRSFGFVFAAVFAIVGLWPLMSMASPREWALAIALAFAATAFARPRLLRPLNRAWQAFGRLLHRIVSPLILGTIFFLCVTPTGWIMRWRGRDLLSLARRPDLKSYWIDREALPPQAQSMKKQY